MAVNNDEYRERTPLDDAFVQKFGPKVPVAPTDLFGAYDAAAEAAWADDDYDRQVEESTGYALCPECGCYAMKTYVRATRNYGGGWDTGGTCHYCGYKEANV